MGHAILRLIVHRQDYSTFIQPSTASSSTWAILTKLHKIYELTVGRARLLVGTNRHSIFPLQRMDVNGNLPLEAVQGSQSPCKLRPAG